MSVACPTLSCCVPSPFSNVPGLDPEPTPPPTEPPLLNLIAWYKADAQSFDDGDEATPIVDSSDSGFNLTTHGNPPGIHRMPRFATSVLNGLSVFRWNEVDDIFNSSVSLSARSGHSMAMVARRTALAPASPGISVTSMHSSGSNAGIRSYDDAGAQRWEYYGLATFVSLTVPLGEWQIITATFSVSEGVPRLFTNDLAAMGSPGTGTLNFDYSHLQWVETSEIAEVLHYDVKLSNDDVATLRQYLSNKYDIAITV